MDGQIIIKVPKRKFGFRIWRKQGFFFAMASWLMMSDHHDTPLSEIDKIGEKEFRISAIYHAAVWYNLKNNIPLDFDYQDAAVWYNKLSNEDFQSLMQTLVDSRIGGERLSDYIQAGEKKK